MPEPPPDLDAFLRHHRATVAFSHALREERCRRTRRFDEGVRDTVGAFGSLFSSWNVEIILVLYMHGPHHFNALRRLLGVSSRVLSDKLAELCGQGYVERTPADARVLYDVSGAGAAVAAHLHPLVFFVHNRDRLGPLGGPQAQGPSGGRFKSEGPLSAP